MEDNNSTDFMRFDLPKDHNSIIKVIGVGGGGSNAVNYMYEQGIQGVDFIVCNTDSQALDKSPVPLKIQLGATLTDGKGAGAIPEVGRNAAIENLEEIKEILGKNTTMVFITAGMGGGTGTGAAPIIAKAAREMGILTVGIVTIPFAFEGKKRKNQADFGLTEMRDAVDTLLIIRNDKVRELYGNLTLKAAFSHADEVLCTAAKGIAEMITLTGEINVDMNDVKTVMKNSGVAIMGSARASGEGRAFAAVSTALESPLLNDNDITGANYILLNITYGQEEVLMDEITEITEFIQESAGMNAEVIWGYGSDNSLGEDLCVTVIATGFPTNQVNMGFPVAEEQPIKINLEVNSPKEIVSRIQSPIDINARKDSSGLVEVSPAIPEIPFLKTIEEPVNENIQPVLFSDESLEETKDQVLFNVETPAPVAKEEEKKIFTLDDPIESIKLESVNTDSIIFNNSDELGPEENRPSRDILLSRNRQREQKIREYTQRMKTAAGLNELEAEPAFRRQGLKLDNVPHSSESNLSRFALNTDMNAAGEKVTQIKPNNPFLHDNAD